MSNLAETRQQDRYDDDEAAQLALLQALRWKRALIWSSIVIMALGSLAFIMWL